MRIRWWRAMAMAGVPLLLAGCAGRMMPGAASTTTAVTSTSAGPSRTDSVSGTVSSGAGSSLQGRTFLSTTVTGHDLADGTRISVSFADGQLSAYAGCNTMSGAVSADGGRLVAAELGMTEIGCPSALAEQDSWLIDFLSAGPTWHLDGDDLTLSARSVTVELTDKKVADPDLPVVGTTWELTGLIEGDAASSLPSGSTPVHLEADDDTLRLWNDCVDIAGHYTFADGTLAASLAMPPVTSTCDVAPIAAAVAVLGQGATVTVDADQLQLLAPDGSGLMFSAVGAGTNPPGGVASGGPTPTTTESVPTSTAPRAATTAPSSVSATPRSAGSVSTTGSTSRTTDSPPADNPLAGRTFALTRLLTDNGGVDTKYPNARLQITFGSADADAVSQCGRHHYGRVRVEGQRQGWGTAVDLGTPTGPDCSLGTDPHWLPSGTLYFGQDVGGEYYLSTGAVAWYFDEVTG